MASKVTPPYVTPPAAIAAASPKKKGPKGDAVRYPQDRRQTVWLRPRVLAVLVLLILIPLTIAWGQYLLFGLPYIHVFTPAELHHTAVNTGFPVWLRLAHFANFLLMMLIIRSGLSILWDHPRLYSNVNCVPGTEWLRFTPIKVSADSPFRSTRAWFAARFAPIKAAPGARFGTIISWIAAFFAPVKVTQDQLWTAIDDSRYLSPWIGLPGYRHTAGLARSWHFVSDLLWIIIGAAYIVMLFVSGHWARLVPMSWDIIPQAWANFVYYATFHLPPEPDGFFHYNAMQQIAYFAVSFVMAPLSILTGLAMSPALANRFAWYPKIFGGRQRARSLHFLLLVGYVTFIIIHVSLVFLTGGVRNMNHIVMGRDDTHPIGLILGLIGIAAVIAACFAAHWIAWNRPRAMQRLAKVTVNAIFVRALNNFAPRAEYQRADISPRLWPNGKLPTSDEWAHLAADNFRNYRLRIHGLVDNPVELSLDDIKAMEMQRQTTMHDCIQGWSGIAEWGGLPMTVLMDLVQPQPDAKVGAFYSFGESVSGSSYYDTHTIENLRHPQSLLAYEMNYEPLGTVHGAPLRLRVENQLGYKMVKWIKEIEFIASEKEIGEGYGGTHEDEEYFDLVADI